MQLVYDGNSGSELVDIRTLTGHPIPILAGGHCVILGLQYKIVSFWQTVHELDLRDIQR